LKDQLLQNGKNNLVLKQVALAMMQQQQQQAVPHPQTILTTANGVQLTPFTNSNQIYSTLAAGIPNGALLRVS
jgi:hypothetical protein